METKICETFWYRVGGEQSVSELEQKFNAQILRNNTKLDLYQGEWVRVQVNDFITHIVKPTELLCKIAELYNIEKEKLIKDNNLESEKLFIGQCLKVYK